MHATHSDEIPVVGTLQYYPGEDTWAWSRELFEFHGVDVTALPTTELLLQRIVAEDRPAVVASLREHLATPGPCSFSYRVTDARGVTRHVAFVGQSEAGGDPVRRLRGFVVDISDEIRARATEAVQAAAEHRSAIEQAKGALMLTFGVDDDMAFSLLRGYSMRYNIKLAQLAARIMECLSLPAYADLGPGASLLAVLTDLEHDPEHFPPSMTHPDVVEPVRGPAARSTDQDPLALA